MLFIYPPGKDHIYIYISHLREKGMSSSKVPWYGILLVPRMVYQFDLDLEFSDA